MIDKTNNYDNIINLKYPIHLNHPRMPAYKRSAQFAPFAALKGYTDAVKETARLTSNKKELSNEEKLILNEKLKYIHDNLLNKEEVSITYFIPDKRKKGGNYLNKRSTIKTIDLYNRKLIFMDSSKVNIDDIIKIDFNN